MEEMQRAGKPLDGQYFFYLNVAFGINVFHLEYPMSRFHVCRVREYGCLAVVFHEVCISAFSSSISNELASEKSTCATIIWVGAKFDQLMLVDGLNAIEDIAQSIELGTGRPCLIPYIPRYLPEKLEIACCPAGGTTLSRHVILVDRSDLPVVSHSVAASLLLWEGHDKHLGVPDNPTLDDIMLQAALWQRKAIRALGCSDTQFCVVAAQTWVEVFTVRLTVEINNLMNSPIPDLRSSIMRNLPQFLNNWLGSRYLKGRWDHKDKTTEFGNWFADCFALRNLVVHAGKNPTREEAVAAYNAAHALVWHVTECASKLNQPELAGIVPVFKNLAQQRRGKKIAADAARIPALSW